MFQMRVGNETCLSCCTQRIKPVIAFLHLKPSEGFRCMKTMNMDVNSLTISNILIQKPHTKSFEIPKLAFGNISDFQA